MTEAQTLVFVGTYTTHLPHVDGKADGVSVYRLNMMTGALSLFSQLEGQINPAYLAIAPNRKYLYIANEIEAGQVTACKFDYESRQLKLLNQQDAQGSYPCHVTIPDSGRFALVANYGGGNLTIYPIGDDGHLGKATDHVQHEGSSINPARQEAAHVHCIAVDSENNRVFVADLGMDKIMIYEFDEAKGVLSPAKQASVNVQAGAGVRHLAFHPNGKFLFAINELNSSITVFTYEGETGFLEEAQTISTLPDDFQGGNSCAAIHVHPSGQFVYGSNRGHDSIAIFTFDEKIGQLNRIDLMPTQGRTPRDFAIDPSGTFLLAANQDTDTIISFRIDQQTGLLSDIGQRLETPTPVCIKIRIV